MRTYLDYAEQLDGTGEKDFELATACANDVPWLLGEVKRQKALLAECHALLLADGGQIAIAGNPNWCAEWSQRCIALREKIGERL